MPESLENQFISDHYTSLLHLSAFQLSNTPAVVYDGSGRASSISVASSGYGVNITGLLSAQGGATIQNGLTANHLVYPTVDGSPRSVMMTDGFKNLTLEPIQTILPYLTPGVYHNAVITVNPSGQLAKIEDRKEDLTFYYYTTDYVMVSTAPTTLQVRQFLNTVWPTTSAGLGPFEGDLAKVIHVTRSQIKIANVISNRDVVSYDTVTRPYVYFCNYTTGAWNVRPAQSPVGINALNLGQGGSGYYTDSGWT